MTVALLQRDDDQPIGQGLRMKEAKPPLRQVLADHGHPRARNGFAVGFHRRERNQPRIRIALLLSPLDEMPGRINRPKHIPNVRSNKVVALGGQLIGRKRFRLAK